MSPKSAARARAHATQRRRAAIAGGPSCTRRGRIGRFVAGALGTHATERPLLHRRLRDGPQPLERAAEQARHVHLRDAEALGDLVLEQLVLKAQLEDDALALGEGAHAGGEHAAVLDRLEALVLLADRAGQVVAVVVVEAAAA